MKKAWDWLGAHPGVRNIGGITLGVGTVAGIGNWAYHHRHGEGGENRMKMAAGFGIAAIAGLALHKTGLIGMGTKLGGAAMTGIAGLESAGRGLESGARFALIDRKSAAGIEGWMPHLHEPMDPHNPFKKISLNKKIVGRIIGAGAALGVANAYSSSVFPKAPPASVYYDGQQMRRRGDMGATGQYAQRMINQSNMGGMGQMDYEALARGAVHIF